MVTTTTRTINKQPPQQSAVAMALRKGSLGVPSVVFFLLGAIGPLMAAAGVITTFLAVTGLTGAPIFFLTVAVVLAIFSVGYVAMARHITNAGSFYAFIRFGLGRPMGVAAALVALFAYNMLQVGLFGMFGPAMSSWAADNLHINWPWYAWALLAWLVGAVLGVRDVKVSARVLAVLSLVEIVVILVLSLTGLSRPAIGGNGYSTLSPTGLLSTGAGAGGVIAVLAFGGFEAAPVFGEEARDRRTVPVATYLTLSVIAVVYVLASLAMTVHYGTGQVTKVAAAQGPETLFALSGGVVASIARALFLTSLFASLLAYHNAVARYGFALGREAVLPTRFGRTARRSGAPWAASLTQSGIALVIILLYAVKGWDPVVHLFYFLGTTGGFGILTLLTATSISVVAYFARDPQREPVWRRAIAPALAGLLLIVMVVLAVTNYPTLLGVAPGSLSAKLLPASFLLPAVVGLGWAMVLRRRHRAVYEAIGLGAEAPLLTSLEAEL